MMTTRAVSTPIQAATETPGCWANFVSGAGKTVNWCGRQIAIAATAVWGGIQKIATWAAAAFKRLAFYAGIGLASAIAYVKAHSVAFIIGGSALAAGIVLGLLFNRACGCCNKPTALQNVETQAAAVNQAAEERNQAVGNANQNLAEEVQELNRKVAAAAVEAADQPTHQALAMDAGPLQMVPEHPQYVDAGLATGGRVAATRRVFEGGVPTQTTLAQTTLAQPTLATTVAYPPAHV